MKMPHWRLSPFIMTLLLLLMTSQVSGANAPEGFNVNVWLDEWFGSDAPPMSDIELESIVCVAAATSVGVLITLVGGAAIVIAGEVGGPETAIALPLLVSSMWAACAIGRNATPGMLWLQRRSKVLVERWAMPSTRPWQPPLGPKIR